MRRLAVLLGVAALVGVGLSWPASGAIPPTCHLGPGKIAAATSHSTRSVDVRFPSISCSTPGVSEWIRINMWNGSRWDWVDTPFKEQHRPVVALPGRTVTTSCPHQALVQAIVFYSVKPYTIKTAYTSNSTICS